MKKKWLALICAFAAAGTGVLNASSVCVNAAAAEKSWKSADAGGLVPGIKCCKKSKLVMTVWELFAII